MITAIQADITTLAVDAIVNVAKIAIREVNAFLVIHPEMEVTFCCFSRRDKEVYEKLMVIRRDDWK